MKVEQKTIETVEYVYQITLSKLEAEVLMSIMGDVLGAPATTYRGFTDTLWDALDAQGVECNKHDVFLKSPEARAVPDEKKCW